MKIVLHAGFHKSGTTSIQQGLLNLKSKKIIYPIPKKEGPGHAHIARISNDPGRRDFNPNILIEMAKSLRKKNFFKILVISSEVFTKSENFDAIRVLSEHFKVHLVLTRRPVYEALPSQQQERIKHGSVHGYLSKDGLNDAENSMQFNFERIDTFINSANFDVISVISTKLSTPFFLVEKFNEILGTNLETFILNKRLGPAILDELVKINKLQPFLNNSQRIELAINNSLKNKVIYSNKESIFQKYWEGKEEEINNYFCNLAKLGKINYLISE